MTVSSPLSLAKINIVGAGIAGLMAATELARAGAKVALFEQAAELGGRARTRKADGFFLNQGPHALYIKGAFLRELKGLGIPFSGQKTKPAEPQVIWQGKLHRFPDSLASLVTGSFFSLYDKLDFVRSQKALADGAPAGQSFERWLDGQAFSPPVRATMEGVARVASYANAPAVVDAKATLEQMQRGVAGVLYLDGGWSSLVDGLRDAAVAAGAEIRSGAAVERIAVEGLRTRTVLADGGEQVADATLLAIGPKEAAALAPNVQSLAAYAAEGIPARANALDLALERLPEGAREFVLGLDVPIYFSLHSKAARLAPEGGAVVHIARYMAPDEAVRTDAIEELETVADLAMPGWRRLEKRRQTLRGITVAHGVVRWDRPRPGVVLPDAPGVFIAGDWVGDEGMISDAAASSATVAARAIVNMLEQRGVSRSAA
jgi:phytoene dehydrogenase-like protein